MSTARPILTEYEDGRRGHSASPSGALRAAFRQLLAGKHEHCTVWVAAEQLTPAQLRRLPLHGPGAELVLLARLRRGPAGEPAQARIQALYYPEACEAVDRKFSPPR